MLTTINSFQEANLDNAFVFFGALEWCAPCKMSHPIIENLAKEYVDVNFYYVDADASQDLCSSNRISTVPTFVFFKNGEEKKRITGSRTKKQFVESLQDW